MVKRRRISGSKRSLAHPPNDEMIFVRPPLRNSRTVGRAALSPGDPLTPPHPLHGYPARASNPSAPSSFIYARRAVVRVAAVVDKSGTRKSYRGPGPPLFVPFVTGTFSVAPRHRKMSAARKTSCTRGRPVRRVFEEGRIVRTVPDRRTFYTEYS